MLRATQIYEYKHEYLEFSLTSWSFGKQLLVPQALLSPKSWAVYHAEIPSCGGGNPV